LHFRTGRDPDEFAPFKTDYVVYHDDIGDYTNEPTMDGTAGTVYLTSHVGTAARPRDE